MTYEERIELIDKTVMQMATVCPLESLIALYYNDQVEYLRGLDDDELLEESEEVFGEHTV